MALIDHSLGKKKTFKNALLSWSVEWFFHFHYQWNQLFIFIHWINNQLLFWSIFIILFRFVQYFFLIQLWGWVLIFVQLFFQKIFPHFSTSSSSLRSWIAPCVSETGPGLYQGLYQNHLLQFKLWKAVVRHPESWYFAAAVKRSI